MLRLTSLAATPSLPRVLCDPEGEREGGREGEKREREERDGGRKERERERRRKKKEEEREGEKTKRESWRGEGLQRKREGVPLPPAHSRPAIYLCVRLHVAYSEKAICGTKTNSPPEAKRACYI